MTPEQIKYLMDSVMAIQVQTFIIFLTSLVILILAIILVSK